MKPEREQSRGERIAVAVGTFLALGLVAPIGAGVFGYYVLGDTNTGLLAAILIAILGISRKIPS